MKQITGRYHFTIERNLSGMILSLDIYTLALYPFTYSIMDCLEHFCDEAGWELDNCLYHHQGITSTYGTAVMLRPLGTKTFAATFRSKARTLYREGRGK